MALIGFNPVAKKPRQKSAETADERRQKAESARHKPLSWADRSGKAASEIKAKTVSEVNYSLPPDQIP